jgi:myo-inositol-1(or 4)-monophosphatase
MRPPIITVLAGILHKATKAVPRDLGEIANLQNTVGGNTGFMTASLQRLWHGLVDELIKAYPGHGILTPQGLIVPSNHPKQATWILDGLSGQDNFARGLGHVAVSLALREAAGLTLGVVFEPAQGELFWAVRGGGAFLNQTRLRVSRNKEPLKALLGFHVNSRDCTKSGPLNTLMSQHVGPIRLWGSPALDMAYVAAGRLDGCYLSATPFASLAAGIVLMKEAGAMILRPGHSLIDENPSELIAASESVWTWMRSFWPDMPPIRSDRPDEGSAWTSQRPTERFFDAPTTQNFQGFSQPHASQGGDRSTDTFKAPGSPAGIQHPYAPFIGAHPAQADSKRTFVSDLPPVRPKKPTSAPPTEFP